MLQIHGENGAGKTSLLRILCGLRQPESGRVCWNGMPIVQNRPDYHRALAYLSHNTALKAELTPLENLDVAQALSAQVLPGDAGLPGGMRVDVREDLRTDLQAGTRADTRTDGQAGTRSDAPTSRNEASRAALHRLGLHDCLDLPCRILSAGQRQRVALARIALRRGGIWILDEPATALDQTSLRLLEQMLEEQVATGGMVVFTSHRHLTLNAPPPQPLFLERFR